MKKLLAVLFSFALVGAISASQIISVPTFANQKNPAGTLYEDHTGTTVTVTAAGTYYPWISASAGHLLDGMTSDVTDSAGDHLTVPSRGLYLVLTSGAYTAGNADITACRVAVDGVGSVVVRWERTMSAAARIGSASASGLLDLTAGQELRLECTSDTNGDAIVLHNVQLTATRVGR